MILTSYFMLSVEGGVEAFLKYVKEVWFVEVNKFTRGDRSHTPNLPPQDISAIFNKYLGRAK